MTSSRLRNTYIILLLLFVNFEDEISALQKIFLYHRNLQKSSFLSPISVFYKPNRLKVAKIQPNKNLIRNCPKKEILTAKVFSYLKDQKRVSVFAYVPLTSRESQIRTIGPVNGTADPLQLSQGPLACCCL